MRENGRSMVEMLGVLAIIGVLSVGAISGYSKAMLKYKLNKQAEQINYLINSALIYGGNLGSAPNTGISYERTSLIPILKKLNAIPVEMLQEHDEHLLDALNNSVYVFAVRENSTTYYQAAFKLSSSSYNQESCRNLVNTIKANSAAIHQINIGVWQSNTPTSVTRYYGDNYCNPKYYKCLKDITVTETSEFCNTCNNQAESCSFGILWNWN